MSSAAFVKMIEAYRDSLGTAFPRQDMAAVIKVFQQCAKGQTTTQDRIRQATGLSATNLSKVVKRASERDWIDIAALRGADGTKQVSLTAKGRKTLEDFESRCVAACSEATKAALSRATKSPPGLIAETGRGGKPISVREKGRRDTLKLFNEDGTPRIP